MHWLRGDDYINVLLKISQAPQLSRLVDRLEIIFTLKGQFNEILDLQFCHHSNLSGPLTNGLKYFRILLYLWCDIQISVAKKTDSPGYDAPRIKKMSS